jgi:glucose dehydrogenase
MRRTPTALACLLAASLASIAAAQTREQLAADGNGGSTDHVLTYGMGYHQHRWSPLTQIDRKTVERLVPVWSVSLASNYGEQGQPLVYDGVMYVTNAEYTAGQRYQGFENLPAPRAAGLPIGHVDAIDPLSATQKWRMPIFDIPHYAAVLATAGGLLFTGKQTGEFIAIDIDTGTPVWQFQTGSGINAQPVTFTHKRRQMVAVQVGIGGVNVARMGEQLRNIPRGGSVWTFALMPE